MRLLFLAGFALFFWNIAIAVIKLLAQRRIRRHARRGVDALVAEAKSSKGRIVRGKIHASGEVPEAPSATAEKVVAATRWVSLRKRSLDGAVPERTDTGDGLSLLTSDGTIALDGPLRVSAGRYTDLPKGGAATFLEEGDEVIALVRSSLGYREQGADQKESAASITEIFAEKPRAIVPIGRLRFHPLAVVGLLLGLILGNLYGDSFITARNAIDGGCTEFGQCHVRTWLTREKVSPTLILDMLAGHVFTAVPLSDADCAGSRMCSDMGACSVSHGECKALKRTDCQYTDYCVRLGFCSPVNGMCLLGVDEDCPARECEISGRCSVVTEGCGAKTDEQCKASAMCAYNGSCLARDGACIEDNSLGADASCKSSTDCLENGECARKGLICVAASSIGCSESQACSQENRCVVDNQEHTCVSDHKPCRESEGCKLYGHCQDSRELCLVSSDSDCAQSEGCALRGECHKVGDECVKDCQTSFACRLKGLCGKSSTGCDVATEAGCKQSRVCAEHGLCSVVDGRCAAARDEDCEHSADCSKEGKCSSDRGSCSAMKDADCRGKPPCLRDGLCSARHDHCMAGSDADCKASVGCKAERHCVLKDDDCTTSEAAACRTSAECKVLGHCSYVASACTTIGDADCQDSEVCKQRGWCSATKDGHCFLPSHS